MQESEFAKRDREKKKKVDNTFVPEMAKPKFQTAL
jgi:hypothetical protein